MLLNTCVDHFLLYIMVCNSCVEIFSDISLNSFRIPAYLLSIQFKKTLLILIVITGLHNTLIYSHFLRFEAKREKNNHELINIFHHNGVALHH